LEQQTITKGYGTIVLLKAVKRMLGKKVKKPAKLGIAISKLLTS
jgi:hypothetical protein